MPVPGWGRGLVLLVLVVVVVVTGIRVLGLDRGFPVVAVMTVFPHVVLLGAATTAAAALLRLSPEVVVGVVTTMIGLALLAPRALPGPTPPVAPDGPRVTVAVAALREGRGDADAVVSAVDDARVDVLVVLELTEDAIRRLRTAGLDERLPETVLVPSRFTSGGGIWSRHPLTAREPSRARGFGATPRATVDVPGHGPLDVDTVHPLPPITAEWTSSWARALAALPPPATPDEPRRLLAGDVNATLDHRRFRALLDLGWVDAADARGAGLHPTFHGLPFGDPVPPVTLDHVLVDPQVAVEHVATRELPGSDHRVLVVRLLLPAA